MPMSSEVARGTRLGQGSTDEAVEHRDGEGHLAVAGGVDEPSLIRLSRTGPVSVVFFPILCETAPDL